MSNPISPELAARIRDIKARMQGGAAGAAEAPAQPAASRQDAPAAAAGGGAEGGDMASRIAAIKARMAGGAAAGGATTATAAPAKAAPAKAGAGAAAAASGGADVQARIAALKAKMDAGKGQPAGAAATATAPAPAAKPKAKAAGSAKAIFPVQPINRRTFGDERLYRPNTVNLWFAAGSLVLLVSVFMMWGRDHVRGWKPIQEAFREREIQRLTAAVGAAEQAVDPAAMQRLDERLAAIGGQLDAQQDAIADHEAAVQELDGVYYAKNQAFQIEKSTLDEMRYHFEEERLLHGDDSELLADSRAALEAQRAEVAALKLAADNAQLDLEARKEVLAGVLGEQTALTRERDGLTEQRDRLELSLAKMGVTLARADDGQVELQRSIFHDYVRNAPVADMLSATLKIDKIVLDDLKDNYNFMYVGRVDMCTTCHVAIDRPEYTDWDPDNSRTDQGLPGERVLSAHPRLDLFVADDSPHPKAQFGCTVCHLGKGQSVEFERTFHTPTADEHETVEEKTARWVADYQYDPERHYWDWPMTPSDLLYSSCWQCHQETDRLPGVPEYNESRALVEDLGCYGCHKVQGLEHLRKSGPDLTNLAAKTSETWSQKWVMAPKAFRPTTRMPHFWNQSNSGDSSPRIDPHRPWENNSDAFVADWRARNDVEGRAVVAYVFDRSQQQLAAGSYEMLPVPAAAGDPAAGRATFEQRGCLGCHSLGEDDTGGEGWTLNMHGPELSSVGSKVSARWLYNWLLDPKKYYPTTVMPDLRLTEQEAWNVTAFLMAQRDADWEAIAPPRGDAAILESIAIENLASVAGDDWAAEQVAQMRAEGGDRAVELFVGEKLFNRYGCSGCHLVPGHQDDMGIGTELTYESLKELSKFDFAFEASHANPEAIGHSREAWYRRKLTDPRVYDRLPVVADGPDGEPTIVRYEQKIKAPGEKLKMPNYYLEPDEIQKVVQFLVGLREDGVGPTKKARLSADEALVERGSRLITQYNCIGCHRMGQLPVTVPIEGDDVEERQEAFLAFLEDAMDQGVWTHAPVELAGQTIFEPGDWLIDEFYDPVEEETILLDEDWFEDWFEDHPGEWPLPDQLSVYGQGEGGMGRFIEDSALRPPVLRGEGAKVNPDWLFGFLVDPYTVRTHVEVRMPTFGLSPDESLALVRWFAARADEPWPFELDADPAPDDELLAEGRRLFHDEFRCNSCHPAGSVLPSNPDKTNWGPDLSMAADRLQTSWMHDWLYDPQAIQPGTRMPNFLGSFEDGEYNALYGDWEQRIRAVTHYLKHMRAAESKTGS